MSADEEGEALQYKPLLDFGRFRKFLEAEQERAIKEDNPMKAQDAQEMAKRLEQEMAELGIKSPEEGNFILLQRISWELPTDVLRNVFSFVSHLFSKLKYIIIGHTEYFDS